MCIPIIHTLLNHQLNKNILKITFILYVPHCTVMPKEGFRSITIRQDLRDEMHVIYETNRHKLNRQGISSFSGFLVMVVNYWNDKESKR